MTLGTPAFANEVRWTLQDVLLDDGGTASGSFVYDAVTSEITQVNFVTTDGSRRLGQSYMYGNFAGNTVYARTNPVDYANSEVFNVFWGVLSDSGGNFILEYVSEWSCGPEEMCENATNFRYLVSGSMTGVPVAVSVTELSASSGDSSGGQQLIITGTNLKRAQEVSFGGVLGTIVEKSSTSMTVITPAHVEGPVSIVVTSTDGVSENTAADDFTFVRSASIPTLSEWAMILFGFVLAGSATLFVQRRRSVT